MSGNLYSIVYITSFVILLVLFVGALYQFARTLGGVREDRKKIANFIAPFIFVLPGILTKKGNHHRIKFFIFALLATAIAFGLFQMESMYGKPPYMEQLNN